jgi:tRNA (guanine-N7-)-methyltransferase
VGKDRPGGRTARGAALNAPARQLYGRRRGKRLSDTRRARFAAALPRLRLTLEAPVDPAALFAGAREVWLEIGFGAGEHLAAQAAARPDIGIIGVEPFETGVAKLLSALGESGARNVRVLMDDARLLLPLLPDASIDRVFLLFPDPWPKLRHHKRRFVSPETLAALARVLKDGGRLRFASDDVDYVRWTLVRIAGCPAHGAPVFRWLARRPADWRERPAGWVETRYEQKALAAGRRCTYLDFQRTPRSVVRSPHVGTT